MTVCLFNKNVCLSSIHKHLYIYYRYILWRKDFSFFFISDFERSGLLKSKEMVSTRQSSNMGSSSGNGGGGTSGEEASSLKKHQPGTAAGTSNGGSTTESPPVRNLNLLNLPVEILEKIFGYLDYNTVAHLRPVSRSDSRSRELPRARPKSRFYVSLDST